MKAGELVEFQPRLYRAFLQERFGVVRPHVRGDLPLETVRDDVQELLSTLRAADAADLREFVQRFPLSEGTGMKSYFQRTSEPDDEGAQKKLATMEKALEPTKETRLRERLASKSLELPNR